MSNWLAYRQDVSPLKADEDQDRQASEAVSAARTCAHVRKTRLDVAGGRQEVVTGRKGRREGMRNDLGKEQRFISPRLMDYP